MVNTEKMVTVVKSQWSGGDTVIENEGIIVVKSEDDAIALLKQLVEGFELGEGLSVKFEGWPRFVISINGADFHGTIPTRIMPTLLDLQKEVHRTYCLATYGEESLRRLTKKDREQLELVVKVDKGSSLFEAILEDPVVKILTDALNRMTPSQVTATVILFGLSVTSLFFWKMWLAKKAKDKELDHAVELSRLEKEKIEVIAKAMRQFPAGEMASVNIDNVRHKLLTNLKAEDQLSISSESKRDIQATPVQIRGDQAEQFTKAPRETAVERLVDGEFFLKAADFSKPEHVRLTLDRISDNYQFRADVPLGVLQPDQIELLKDHSWAQINLKMKILVNELHGRYTSAKVISVDV